MCWVVVAKHFQNKQELWSIIHSWSYVLKLSFWQKMRMNAWNKKFTKYLRYHTRMSHSWDITLACHTHKNTVRSHSQTHVTHRNTHCMHMTPLCTAEIVVLATVQSDLSVLLDVDKLGRAWRKLGCFTFRKVEKRLRRLREGWQKNEKWLKKG